MVAEHKIDRQKLISGHNPVLTEIATDSPLTVGNGEPAFTADITGMQTLYEEYQEAGVACYATKEERGFRFDDYGALRRYGISDSNGLGK